jgi:hypothetical protein
MHGRQRRHQLVVGSAATILFGLAMDPASSAPLPEAQDPCLSATAVPVDSLPALSLCDLTGRLVTGEGVGVRVPAVGQAVSINALQVDREVVLEVRHEAGGTVSGLLTVLGPDESPDQAGIVTQDMVGGQVACSDAAFTSSGSKESDTRLWYYDRDTDPVVGSPAAAYHEQGVTSAVVNLLAGYNDCGLVGGFQASQTYLGNTTARSNITADSTCGGMDGQNVVDWGSVTNPNTLGLTCRYDFLLDLPGYDEILEADIKIANAHSYLAGAPTSTCDNSYDVMGLMTHEWGHAFGLSHTPDPVADHRQQTMSPVLTPCSTFQRTLGRGDWTGMNTVYGVR